MKSKTFWTITITFVIILAFYLVYTSVASSGKYDDFAHCLTDNGVKMFGAYWCPHCQAQKTLFGKSFNNINYIECSLPNGAGQTEECNLEGINSYPTWEFSDGSRFEGEISLQELSQRTGCPLSRE